VTKTQEVGEDSESILNLRLDGKEERQLRKGGERFHGGK